MNKNLFGLFILCFSLQGCMNTLPRYWRSDAYSSEWRGKVIVYPDSNGFAQIPSEYLIDESGHFIDENGNRVQKPVKNPYFDDFKKSRK